MIDYNTADRIELLKEVITDPKKQEVDDQKLEDILCDRYPDFVRLCEEVESNRTGISSITSTMENGQVKFEIQRK